jgi:hypothetical protein
MAATGSGESSAGAESGEDDTKRRFREALERKKAKSANATAHRDGGAKQSRSHGPVENRREFRRKSG